MKPRSIAAITGICIIMLAALAISPAGAAESGPSWASSPEHIAALQAYAAYSGELYKAKMDGAIRYIGSLNGSAGTTGLGSDEQQFLATVASVPSMTTNDAVMQALGSMKSEIAMFRSDLGTAMTTDKGSAPALRAAINASVSADQATIQNLETAYWTLREKSRLDEFSYNDGRRTGLISNLSARGASVIPAQDTENRIRQLQSELQAGFSTRNESGLKDANDQLDALNAQFIKEVRGSSWQVRETMRLNRFDNTTARMQERLTNLTAAGRDVSAAQTILTQIIGLRPQLQAALANEDTDGLKAVNSQLETLDKQFMQDLRAVQGGLRQEALNRTQEDRRMNGTPDGRGLNRTFGNRGMNRTGQGRF